MRKSHSLDQGQQGGGRLNKSLPVYERLQTVGEEIANSVSHGIGFVVALIALPFLVVAAFQQGGTWGVIGASVFVGTMALLYLASTLYHAWPNNKVKDVFQLLDHGAIFLFIAGTYTPFTLGVLRGVWGWLLFGLVWTLAILGVSMKVVVGTKYPRLSTGLYLGMGWLGVIAIWPLWAYVPLTGFLWLLAGGIAYTVGVVFFIAERVRYAHFVWHLFVLTGTSCHFLAVLWYAA
jgi:hemolysin III